MKLGECSECSLIQLMEDYDHNSLYNENYGYRSSLNTSMVQHLQQIAKDIIGQVFDAEVGKTLKILDIGCNDGTLIREMKNFARSKGKFSIEAKGVDPSGEAFQKYYDPGELTVGVFDESWALNCGSTFDVITSIAMFYDLPNPISFAKAIKMVLSPNGTWTSEQSYFYSMIEQNAFDTICQEHLEYYSLLDVINVCESAGLRVIKVSLNESNGGSFRFTAVHSESNIEPEASVKELLNAELLRPQKSRLIQELRDNIEVIKHQLLYFLQECRNNGILVHGYGASTKGNTLLQYFGIDENLLPAIAEINETKFGSYTPGTLIPIISEEESRNLKPAFWLVLPWHFRNSIIERELKRNASEKIDFIFPLPNFEIMDVGNRE